MLSEVRVVSKLLSQSQVETVTANQLEQNDIEHLALTFGSKIPCPIVLESAKGRNLPRSQLVRATLEGTALRGFALFSQHVFYYQFTTTMTDKQSSNGH